MRNWFNEKLIVGESPSGKATGFGPVIAEVRILPPQPLDVNFIPILNDAFEY